MYIIAGLGNPGRKYELTKHNVGFMALDMYAKKHGVNIEKKKFDGLYCKCNIKGEDVLLVKPQTFMNLSGDCIAQFVNYFKVPHENLIVVFDDVEFDMGNIKIRAKGSGGTHNGMRDIVAKLGDGNFPRVRVGIGNDKSMELFEYVLAPFTHSQIEEIISPACEKVCDALDMYLQDDIDTAMNKFNTKKQKKQLSTEGASENKTDI